MISRLGGNVRRRKLIVFDVDSTLVDAEIINELAKVAGVGEEVAGITSLAMRGEIDFGEALRKRVRLLRGLPETEIVRVAKRIPIMPGARHLLKEARSKGYKVIAITGSFMNVVHKVDEKLNLDHIVANELVIKDGVVTGEVRGPLTEQNAKLRVLEQIAKSEGVSLQDCIVVGDGANDLGMFEKVGLSIAFNADPVLKNVADVVIDQKDLELLIPLL
ncbi:MAG: phosphoserine phosphatase SerB [Methanocellales archaeon]|nr:phosphoserine phosphatase SerB [Methanocellales archaeon]